MDNDGRWRVHSDCDTTNMKHACVDTNDRLAWMLSSSADSWNNPTCPNGYQFSFPVTGYENALLRQVKGNEQIWLSYEN